MKLIHDPEFCKLGRNTPHFPKTMRMLVELTAALPTPPLNVGWVGNKIDPVTGWGMDGNDNVGDCAIAAPAHLEQLWTVLVGIKPNVPTTPQVLDAYSAITGYNPADPNTDQGTDPAVMLEYWKNTGLWGSKIDGYVGANPTSQVQIKDSIWFFGGNLIGLQLPTSAQNQTVWDVPPGGAKGDGEPGSWGGHEIMGMFAGPRFVTAVTWGALKNMTYEFLATYCDQLTAVLSHDWLTAKGSTIGGVPLASLTADLNRLLVS